jgi:glycosyltransferase involved in cell wall biosynthesis
VSESDKRVRILSIAHTAVSRQQGRMRYRPFEFEPEFDVHLVAPKTWHEFGRSLTADETIDAGFTLHVEPVVLSRLPKIGWYAHIYPGLPRLIRQLKPDVIHLWEEPWSFVALQACLLRGPAALVLEVDQNIEKRLPPPFETIRRYVLQRTDLILSRSPDATAVARAAGFKGVARPIGYGVDRDTFTPGVQSRAPRRPDAPLRIGYVGRLVQEKGLDDALAAMKRARAPITLHIMGEGPYKQQLQDRVRALDLETRVSFQSWGSHLDVARFLREQDVSLLLTWTTPSVKEQFGRSIIESQSCGVPVIGSTCGAIPTVIGGGGWVVPERSPDALARVMDQIAAAPEDIQARGLAGLRNVEQHYTYEATASALAEGWREAMLLHAEKFQHPIRKSASRKLKRV